MMMLESGRTQRGMTLVELMIVLVIVGILTSVALPLYSRYQERTYRTQAFADLGDCAQALERFYTVNFTYAGADLATICSDTSPPTGTALYDLTLPTATASQFTLRATPVADAAADGTGLIELDASGAKRWDKNADGDTEDAGEDNWTE
jgi:type IV pilus assembly protein PilE